MNRHFNRSIELLLIICLVVSAGLNVYLLFLDKQKTAALREFAIVNNVPIEYTLREIKKIKKYSAQAKVPSNLIKAIGMSEKGLGSHTFGVKKIRLENQILFHVSEWQLIECIDIVKQEMFRFSEMANVWFKNDEEMMAYIIKNRQAFLYQLAARYCPLNQEVWYNNVYKNWKKFDKEDGK